jgi:hypothetical protein
MYPPSHVRGAHEKFMAHALLPCMGILLWRVLLTAWAVIMRVPTVDIFTYAIDMFIA